MSIRLITPPVLVFRISLGDTTHSPLGLINEGLVELHGRGASFAGGDRVELAEMSNGSASPKANGNGSGLPSYSERRD